MLVALPDSEPPTPNPRLRTPVCPREVRLMKHASIYYALSAICLLFVAFRLSVRVDVPVAPVAKARRASGRN